MRTAALVAIESVLFFSWCIIVFALFGATDALRARVGMGEGWSAAVGFLLVVGGSVVTSHFSMQLLKLFGIADENKAGE